MNRHAYETSSIALLSALALTTSIGSACTSTKGASTNDLGGAGLGATAGSGATAGASGSSAAGAGGGASAGSGGSAAMSNAGTGGAGSGTAGVPAVTCGTGAALAGMCKDKAEGVYALKAELDVWWQDEVNNPATPLVDPGRGKITLYFRDVLSGICGDGSSGTATLHPCGTVLPTFVVDVNCKAIKINFADDLWDKPGIPDYTSTTSFSGFNPGDVLSLVQTAGLLGIKLNSVDAAWPTSKETSMFDCGGGQTGVGCFPDQDGDGHPGVTVKFGPLSGKYTMADGAPYKCGTGSDFDYTSAPLSIGAGAFGAAGAEIAYFGTRVSIGGDATLADCSSGTGAAKTSATVPSRVADCVLEQGKGGNGAPCMVADAQFIDDNTPDYHVLNAGETPPSTWIHNREKTLGGQKDPSVNLLDRSPSKGPRLSVVRIADAGGAANCQEVRTAAFPAFQ